MLKNIELKRIPVAGMKTLHGRKIVSDPDMARRRRSVRSKVEQNEARRRAGMEMAEKFVARSP